ncbi:MAG TPA: tetratricopeptide repeat protein [Xanthobacteraceae bacterium]|jgi:tetratricopeptide (TPR) repeat protein
MSLLRGLPLASIALCLWASMAAADDRAICGSVPIKSDAVGACSRIIAAPRTSAHDRVMALTFRGDAKHSQGDNAAAIADYSQALTLQPDYRPALIGRGIAYRDTTEPARAMADFDQAIKLDPKDAKALYERGVAKNKTGDVAGGAADLAAAKAVNPSIGKQ